MTSPAAQLVLGVDPGTNHTGFGLIKVSGRQITALHHGRFSPPANWLLPKRLHYIYEGLLGLFESGSTPQVVALEDVFYAKNVRAAIRLGHARGIVMLAAAHWQAELFEYAPTLVKSTVSGFGRAEKSQIAEVVGSLLQVTPESPDASDALAIALCHASQNGWASILARGGKKVVSLNSKSKNSSWRSFSIEEAQALSYLNRNNKS